MSILIVIILIGANANGQLIGYRVSFGFIRQPPRTIVLRQWQQNGLTKYLTLNATTLETSVVSLLPGNVETLTWTKLRSKINQTPYGRALLSEQRQDRSLQNAGIQRADTAELGINLTIDLCPSTKPLTRSVFEEMIRIFGPEETPIPITVNVSGTWMANHQQDLTYLKYLVSKGYFAITWANHSFHHRYNPVLPLVVNFLLEATTNLNDEVLLNEQVMLKNGLTPSIFFRFPGLISDKTVFDRVLAFGILPIGSDAWLAKNQLPKRGSLVLIHANGNEPAGIRDFISLLQQKAPLIRGKTWLLYDLPTSVANEK